MKNNFIWRPDLRCWLTNRRRCKLRSQRSAGTFAGNQLLPNASLERDGKALIDLVDGLSSGAEMVKVLWYRIYKGSCLIPGKHSNQRLNWVWSMFVDTQPLGYLQIWALVRMGRDQTSQVLGFVLDLIISIIVPPYPLILFDSQGLAHSPSISARNSTETSKIPTQNSLYFVILLYGFVWQEAFWIGCITWGKDMID
jgi:hypothetical protein